MLCVRRAASKHTHKKQSQSSASFLHHNSLLNIFFLYKVRRVYYTYMYVHNNNNDSNTSHTQSKILQLNRLYPEMRDHDFLTYIRARMTFLSSRRAMCAYRK